MARYSPELPLEHWGVRVQDPVVLWHEMVL